MNKQELKMFMIEYAMLSLQTECKSFSNYYDTDLFSIEYVLENDRGIAYINTPDDKIELANISFEDVPSVLHYPLLYTEKPFMALVERYSLQPKPEYAPQITINPEDTNE